MRLKAVVILLCILACSAIRASEIALTISPSHVLPGLPTSLHVVIASTDHRDIVVPNHALLRVVPVSGEPFLAEWGSSQEHPLAHATLPETVGVRGLGAVIHGKREFIFRADDLGHPAWFADPRLNTPGTYRLQVLLVKDVDEGSLSRARALDLGFDSPGMLMSTEAILTVDQPRGDDAQLWKQLVTLTRGNSSVWSPRWWSPLDAHEFAKSALRFPASPYAAYAVPYFASPNPEERASALEKVLEAQPSTPIKDNLEILLGEAEVSAAQNALSGPRPTVKRAIELYDRARTRFETLERNAADPDIKRRSQEDRERLPSPDEIRQRAAAAH